MELPLFKRELIELAQRKRTYALRTIVWLIYFIVFVTMYLDVTSRAGSSLRILGRGREMSEVLFVTLVLTIYALNPAMACSAITSEKEKQTLGLLITSRLSPGGIVLEKICSRMLPLVSLLLIATPLFAVIYLFGGTTFSFTALGLLVLLNATLQITCVAVFCSALLESGIAAFWATYGILAVIYFTLPILRELHLFRINIPSLSDEEFFLFPVYQLAMLMGGRANTEATLWMMLPTLAIAVAFAIGARFAVVYYSYGGGVAFAKQLANFRERITSAIIRRVWGGRRDSAEALAAASAPAITHETILLQRMIDRPVAWRELKSRFFSARKLRIAVVVGALFLEIVLIANNPRDAEEISACWAMGGLVIAVLIVMAMVCRIFALEYERQTFDSLLTSPLSSRDILYQKLLPIRQLMVTFAIFMFVVGLINLFSTDVRYLAGSGTLFNKVYNRRYGTAHPLSFEWIIISLRFLFCSVGSTLVCLELVKWIATAWVLKVRNQMKSLVVSIVSVLILCIVPVMLLVAILISLRSDPDEFPLFFFSTPAIIPCLNEVHELHGIYRNSWLPNSELFAVLFYLGIYGSMALAARIFVIQSLPRFLGRRENT